MITQRLEERVSLRIKEAEKMDYGMEEKILSSTSNGYLTTAPCWTRGVDLVFVEWLYDISREVLYLLQKDRSKSQAERQSIQ